jgi:hypothetical protein
MLARASTPIRRFLHPASVSFLRRLVVGHKEGGPHRGGTEAPAPLGATPGPPLERMSKLLFRLSADADPDLVPYWFRRITAFLGDEHVVARYAGMTHSAEPGVAWLGVWLPTAPEELPETFDLDIVGEHLIVDEEVADESVFDLPMPALMP